MQPRLVEDFNLLGYFQEQRLEHTRLLRKEIQRLEAMEKLCLSSIVKVRRVLVLFRNQRPIYGL